jgi:hypothetical protein
VNQCKCPLSVVESYAEAKSYCIDLYEAILRNPKKCWPNRWWSFTVVKLLLQHHLKYATEFGTKKQDAAFLAVKQQEQKLKFENDKK